jgi:Domain of unknown function (DUF4281)
MENEMTAENLFQVVNVLALLSWLVLIAGVVFKKPTWRDGVAGTLVPFGLAALYTALILVFWTSAEGGFDSLANVQKLFTNPWVALAGWVHYLAFDLFVGAWITKRIHEEGLPKLLLVPLLPLTFMFGPIGYFGFTIARIAFKQVAK